MCGCLSMALARSSTLRQRAADHRATVDAYARMHVQQEEGEKSSVWLSD